MANLSFSGRFGFFDHARMVEDLLNTAVLFDRFSEDKLLRPPAAFFERLGDDFLHATVDDRGAWQIKKDTELHRKLDSLKYISVFRNNLDVTWLMAISILGRKDLRPLFEDRSGAISYERAIAWLVLHGANEHELCCRENYLFKEQLLNGFDVVGCSCAISPLEKIFLIERNEFHAKYFSSEGTSKRAQLVNWIKDVGVSQYGLYWLFR